MGRKSTHSTLTPAEIATGRREVPVRVQRNSRSLTSARIELYPSSRHLSLWSSAVPQVLSSLPAPATLKGMADFLAVRVPEDSTLTLEAPGSAAGTRAFEPRSVAQDFT